MAERISLAEAYNNKDVVTQIAILKDKLDSIPDADLTNVVLKTGDQVIDGEKTFNDPIVANGGVVFANSGIHVNGTLEVDGDIIQNGSAYETHAEQVFTKTDLIVTREDAIGGIAAGQLSGIRVKKYDGVSDLNLGVDSGGIMRVGDPGSEQPLATREEAANMTSGALVKWDGVNNRMIAPASNIGSDTKPVKIVGGVPSEVANALVPETRIEVPYTVNPVVGGVSGTYSSFTRMGKVVSISFSGTITNSGSNMVLVSGLPSSSKFQIGTLINQSDNYKSIGYVAISGSNLLVTSTVPTSGALVNITYICN